MRDTQTQPLVQVEDLKMHFPIYTGVLRRHTGDVKAVVFNADCEVRRGALIGINAGGEADLRTLGIKVRGTASLAGISTPAL